MIDRSYPLEVDISRGTIKVNGIIPINLKSILRFTQQDTNSCRIEVELDNNNKSIDLENLAGDVILVIKTPSGTTKQKNILKTCVEKKLQITLPNDCITQVGTHQAALIIYTNNYKDRITTFDFSYTIEKSLLSKEAVEESSQFDILQELIIKVDNLITDNVAIGLTYEWQGTKLGIKREDEENYIYIDLKGDKGEQGIQGAAGVQGIQGTTGTFNDGTEYPEFPTTSKTIPGAISELFQDVDNGKTIIASAITDQGVETLATDTFEVIEGNIRKIKVAGGAWQPHEDWINIREGNPPNSTVFLVADIYNATTGFLLNFEGSGSAIVDWGDGSFNSVNSHNPKCYHTYKIGSGKPCSLGYTTFKVTIEPQDSNTLLRSICVNKPKTHTTSYFDYHSNILWCRVGTKTLTSCFSMFGWHASISGGYRYLSPMLDCVEGDFENVTDIRYMFGPTSEVRSILLENIKYIMYMDPLVLGNVDNLDWLDGVLCNQFGLGYGGTSSASNKITKLKRLPKINSSQLTSYHLANVIITELQNIDLSTATQLRQFTIGSCVGINKIILSPEAPITRIELSNIHITEGLTSLYESLPDRRSSGGCDIRLNMVSEGLAGDASIATKKGWRIMRSDY